MGLLKIEGVTHWSIPVNNLEESEKFYGDLLGLIPAGRLGNSGMSCGDKAKEWDRVLGINLRGIFLCSQAAAEAMRKRKQGRILNTASNRGVVGEPNASHYAASKAGVIAFTQSMAKEVAPDNILVNAIAPGWTETPMGRAGVTDEYWQKIKSVPPLMGGLTEKDEITGLVRYLLSYATRYITGQLFFLRSPYK